MVGIIHASLLPAGAGGKLRIDVMSHSVGPFDYLLQALPGLKAPDHYERLGSGLKARTTRTSTGPEFS